MSGPLRCPLCGSAITDPRCGVCGADLDGPAARDLATVDQQMRDLAARRQQVLARLSEEARVGSPAAAPTALPGWAQMPAPPPPPSAALPPFLAARPPESVAPGPQVSSILLTLGTGLLVIAALVFAAVSWGRIGPVGQGALLIGLTLAAGLGTDRAARRGLTGTAEALGVLTVVMGPLVAQALRITAGLVSVADRTWSNWGSWTWWPAVVVLVGMAGLAFGRAVAVRSPQWLGSALVQFGLPLWTALAPLPTWMKVMIVAGQAGAVGLLSARRASSTIAPALWWSGTAAAWLWAAVATATMAVDQDLTDTVAWPLAGGLLTLTATAAVVSWAWSAWPRRADGAATAAMAAAIMATIVVLMGSATAEVAWPAAAALGAAAAVVVDRFGGRRRAALAPLCLVLVAGASVPVIGGVLVALDAAGTAADPVWGSTFGARALPAERTDWTGGAAASVAVMIGAIAVALSTVPAPRRRISVSTLVAGALLALVVVVPTLANLTVGVITLLVLAVAGAMTVGALWPGGRWIARPVGLGCASASLVVAGTWSLGTQPLTMVAVLVAFGLGSLVVATAAHDGDGEVAMVATAVVAAAFVAEVGLVAYAVGAPWWWAVAGAATVAAVSVAVLPVADTSGPGEITDGTPSASSGALLVSALSMVLLHVGAAVVLLDGGGGVVPPSAALTLVLAVGAVSWTVAAARRGSGGAVVWWALLAGAEALVLVWFRLAESDVAVVEAYTLPLAVLVAVSAVLLARTNRPDASESDAAPTVAADVAVGRSWSFEGPALALALWPTALIALGDPGLTRQVVGLVAGAALLAGGAMWRRRAMVDVGGATVAVLGLQALLPYVADVPRWISLGLVGIVLVGLGATFEQRRQDFDEARRHYAALR